MRILFQVTRQALRVVKTMVKGVSSRSLYWDKQHLFFQKEQLCSDFLIKYLQLMRNCNLIEIYLNMCASLCIHMGNCYTASVLVSFLGEGCCRRFPTVLVTLQASLRRKMYQDQRTFLTPLKGIRTQALWVICSTLAARAWLIGFCG